MEKCIIYGLFCPFTDELHYVGKSTVGMIRPTDHFTKSHSEKIREWVSQLKVLGYLPIIKVLEECNMGNIDEKEQYWISKSKMDGCYLLNVAHNAPHVILLKKQYSPDDSWFYRMSIIIKTTRLSLDWSADFVSRSAGISRPTLVTIEKRLGKTNIISIKKVLDILGLDIQIIRKDGFEIDDIDKCITKHRSSKSRINEKTLMVR